MKGYKIDFTSSTITITADFAKKMNDPTSAEYKTISLIKKDFPQMKIINKTHKTPESMFPRARAKPLTVISLRTSNTRIWRASSMAFPTAKII